ncbi:hypothetical protein [Pusillimonas sp.]|uniref:hypothetical protein n=1 Tax=Pusillimonas sp. TaxID=3040095 RepID=UPI0039C940A8
MVRHRSLLVALTRAFCWQQLLDDGVVASGSEIAQREGLHHSTVNELLRLTLLEPAIIQSILAGRQPKRMSLLWFQRNPLPTDWVARSGRWWRGLMPDRVTSPQSPAPHHRGIRRTCPPAANRRPGFH